MLIDTSFTLASYPGLPRLQLLIACSMLAQFFHTASDQKLRREGLGTRLLYIRWLLYVIHWAHILVVHVPPRSLQSVLFPAVLGLTSHLPSPAGQCGHSHPSQGARQRRGRCGHVQEWVLVDDDAHFYCKLSYQYTYFEQMFSPHPQVLQAFV